MEDQIKALLEPITTMTTAMRGQNQITPMQTSVNVISNFECFDPKLESFKNYKERLEIHFQIKKISNDKDMCAKLLLQYIGSANYSLLTTLASPKSINSLKYEEIITLLESHFCQKNILVEQNKFLSQVQNEDQHIADCSDCSFVCECGKTVTDIFLRSQFTRGLRKSYIREQLLQTPTATFGNNDTGTSTTVHHIRKGRTNANGGVNSRRRTRSRSKHTQIIESKSKLQRPWDRWFVSSMWKSKSHCK